MLYHVPVQGEGSAAKIAAAITHLNRRAADIGGVDVILLARGGGSLEDLWSFNEEIVARAVADSNIPIITGIGHEIDCSIADLVADYHAHAHRGRAGCDPTLEKGRRFALDGSDPPSPRRATTGRRRPPAIARHPASRNLPPPDGSDSDTRPNARRPPACPSIAMTRRLHTIERRVVEISRRFQESHPRHRLALYRQKIESHDARLHGRWDIAFTRPPRAA